MQNVFKFISSYWTLLLGFGIIVLVVLGCNKLLVSCNNNAQTIANTIDLGRETSNLAQMQKLLDKVESLEKKDSVLQESIKKIDTLRSELRSVKLTVSEQYRFLSSRYADKIPKR